MLLQFLPLRNPTMKALFSFDLTASVDAIIEILRKVSVLKEFYTATQCKNETVTAWCIGLEESLQKTTEKGCVDITDRHNMFWTG